MGAGRGRRPRCRAPRGCERAAPGTGLTAECEEWRAGRVASWNVLREGLFS